MTVQESAVDAVAQGLYYLDSSALAALLKELSKQGQLKRSVEIFDWLRSLVPSHDLAGLCDLYTYTTMISQVSWPGSFVVVVPSEDMVQEHTGCLQGSGPTGQRQSTTIVHRTSCNNSFELGLFSGNLAL